MEAVEALALVAGHDVLFFIKIGSREVHIAGVTQHPSESWMKPVARNVTMEEWGFLCGQRYLIFDRGGQLESLAATAAPRRSANRPLDPW